MRGDEPKDGQDRALWQRYRAANGLNHGDTLPASTLAAWLDDRLSPDERTAVEERLAGDPEALETLLWARGARAEPMSGELAERVASLVTGGGLKPRGARPGAERSRSLPAPARWLGWAALAASLALVSLGGFALGQFSYDDLHAGAAGGLVAELVAGPDDETFGDVL